LARYRESLCRLCRREGMKLFLKGDRCQTDKCAYSRRPYIPGQHHDDSRGRKISEYGKQLREKQKVKRIYGVYERQFRRYFEVSDRKKGETGENLLKMLEKRLDNVIFRSGFAVSRRVARELVSHGHIIVNGKKINIASYEVRPGDKITLKAETLNLASVKKAVDESKKTRSTPTWIEMNFDRLEASIKNDPIRADIALPVQEQLIVELYSK